MLPVEGGPVGTIPETLAIVQVRIEPAVVVSGDGFVYFDIQLVMVFCLIIGCLGVNERCNEN